MKKKLAAILCAVCIFALAGLGAALAETNLAVTVSTARGKLTDTIAVTVDLAGCAGMDSIQFRVNYDAAAIRLVETQTGVILEKGISVVNTDTAGVIAFAYASAEGLAEEGTALTMTFVPLNESGSAIVVTDVLTTTYDASENLQSKAYISLENGGIAIGEEGTVPDPVVTPWPVETPTPTPSPTPEPTPEPVDTEVPEEITPEPVSPAEVFTSSKMLLYIVAGAIVVLVLVLFILLATRKRRR